MGLRLTTKTTVSGWRFLLRRLEHALVRRDTRMFDDPLQFYGRSVAVGIVAAIMICVGAGVLAFFKPQGKLGNSTLVVDRVTNQLFLIVSGQLHPVYNLTSARLVLGKPDNPKAVKSSELQSLPRGQTIGIPGAPYATPVSGDSTSNWTLCDTVTNAASASPGLQTSVIAMPLVTDSSVGPIQPDQAVLASYQGQEWVLTQNGRYTFDRNNRALTTALGMSPNAKPAPVSQGVFNALANLGAMQLPPIPDAGAPNSLGLPPELVTGSVFQTQANSGSKYYVVLRDGIAPVTAPTAAALRATNSYGQASPPTLEPSLVVNIPERDFASPLPDSPLTILSREEMPTLCWSWERKTGDQAPRTAVLAGRHLPIPAANMTTGIQQIQGTATVFIDGGKFIRLQSPDPRYGESLYYVDPQGVRYGLPNEQTAGTIGLTSPKNAPWEIVRLLVDGPVLSQENALLEHDTLPADPSPRNVAPGTNDPTAGIPGAN